MSPRQPCPRCGSEMTIPERYAGRTQHCTKCGHPFIVKPAEDPSTTKECPFCREEIKVDAIKCKHCGEMLAAAPVSPSRERQSGSPTLRALGAILFIGGLVAAVYYFQYFDTTVASPQIEIFGQTVGGGRVHNIGLMQERQSGLLIGGAIAAAGFILVLVGQYLRPGGR